MLDNERVRVTEVVWEPGVRRESYVRPTDQVVVFLEDCEYERIDPTSGDAARRARKSGEAIWHAKGERAPILINRGAKAYRTLLIELK